MSEIKTTPLGCSHHLICFNTWALQSPIKIVNSENLRQEVIIWNNITPLRNFILTKLSANLEFDMKICEVNEVCGMDEYRPEVYARERIVSSTWYEYSPKRVKLFVWEK